MRFHDQVDLLEILRKKGVLEFFLHGMNIIFGALSSKIKIFWLRIRGYDIDYSAYLRGNNFFFQSQKNCIKINKNCEMGYGVRLCSGFGGKVNISNNVGIFDYTIIDIHTSLEIGENCLIAPFCYIGDYDHVIKDRNKPIIDQGYISKPIRIGRNVWIGTKSVILKGITIGDNTIVGAGSIVTRDIPPNSLAAGNPARIIRKL